MFISDEEFKRSNYHSNRNARLLLGRDLLRGEVGTSLAHQGVYKDFIQTEDEWAVVLEDDAQVATPQFASSIQAIIESEDLNRFLNGPLVVLLGYHDYSVLRRPNRLLSRQRTVPTGAYGYLFNRSACSALLQASRVDFLADWPLTSRSLNFFALNSPIVQHSDLAASLSDEASFPLSRRLADAMALSLLRRFGLIRSWSDLAIVWHFVVKRAAAFRFAYPLIRRIRSWK